MKSIIHLAGITTCLLLCACSEQGQDRAFIMKVYQGGNEYSILEKGDAEDHGERAYFIRYLSEDPRDESIRNAELLDLYAIIAMHIDSNEYPRVVIEAVDHRGKRFGILKAHAYRDSQSVQDVLAYKVEKKTRSADQ